LCPPATAPPFEATTPGDQDPPFAKPERRTCRCVCLAEVSVLLCWSERPYDWHFLAAGVHRHRGSPMVPSAMVSLCLRQTCVTELGREHVVEEVLCQRYARSCCEKRRSCRIQRPLLDATGQYLGGVPRGVLEGQKPSRPCHACRARYGRGSDDQVPRS